MSVTIDRLLKLPDLSGQEATTLSADAAAGATSLTVVNIQGFADDNYIVVGNPASEDAEIVQITATPSGTTLAVSALSRAHGSNAPVTLIPYNQIKVYRSDTETGTYSEISGSPFNIEADQSFTSIIDSTGTSAKYYKYSYYNSTSTAESDKSSAYIGGTPSTICTLEEVKQELDIKMQDKSRDAMLNRLIESVANEIINFTGVQYISKTIPNEYQSVDENQDKIFVNYYPILSVTSLYENGTPLTFDSDPEITEYHVFPGYIQKEAGCFYPGYKRAKISYVAYQSPPREIIETAIQIVAIRSGFKTRTFTDRDGITQAVVLTNVPKDIWDRLKRYRRIPI